MPMDHFCIQVPTSKFEDIIKFLTTSLQHMGFKEHVRIGSIAAGLGEERPYFWVGCVEIKEVEDKTLLRVLYAQHIAFTAENSEQVKQFHAAALKAGATCNGPPGLRPNYHPNYYGAFVRDPACGINFEVVCHKGEI